jgi:hypothetical protein
MCSCYILLLNSHISSCHELRSIYLRQPSLIFFLWERFRYFIKVPELATFYLEITDFRTAKDIRGVPSRKE